MVRGMSDLKKRAPSNIHRCEIPMICCLHNKFVHMTVHREWDRFPRKKTPKFVAHIFQNTSRRLRYTRMSAALDIVHVSVSIRNLVNWESYLSGDKIGRWIMQEGFQYSHQSIFVLAQKTEADFACSPKGA